MTKYEFEVTHKLFNGQKGGYLNVYEVCSNERLNISVIDLEGSTREELSNNARSFIHEIERG